MGTTYVPATWVGGLIAAGLILIAVLTSWVIYLNHSRRLLLQKCEQYKASVGVNQRNNQGLILAVQKRDEKIRDYERAEIRHVAQLEAAETRLLKEINSRKALYKEIEALKEKNNRLVMKY